MRVLATLALLACALGSTAGTPPRPVSRPSIAGIITDPALGEFSGLAASRRHAERFWALNDGGNGTRLLLLDSHGRVLRRFELAGVPNVDWEDLASFHWQGRDWLLIADTGDNSGQRDTVSLWLIEEPAEVSADAPLAGARELRLRYPDTPHDIEAVAVDGEAGHAYLLSKRTVPPVLYRVPLAAVGSDRIEAAQRVAALDRIPQPTEREIARDGKLSRFRSQATALAIDCSRRGLLVLTYDAIYRYSRSAAQTWEDALPGQLPARSSIALLPQAEAMALDPGCRNLYVGSEKTPVPLLRFRYRPLPKGSADSDATP